MMTLIVALFVVSVTAWALGWTDLPHLVFGIPVLILGVALSAAMLKLLRQRTSDQVDTPAEETEQPPLRRIMAGAIWGAGLTLLLTASFWLAPRTPLWARVVDVPGRAAMAEVGLLEQLGEWQAIVTRLNRTLPSGIRSEGRRALMAKKMKALLRMGEMAPDLGTGCQLFREAEVLGRAEDFDTSFVVAKLEVCAARLARRALPRGSRAEILRIEREIGATLKVSLRVTDRENRPIGGLAMQDFAVASGGRSLKVTHAEAVSRPVRVGQRLAIVIDNSASTAALSAAALVASSMFPGDSAEVFICGLGARRAGTRSDDPLPVLNMLFHIRPAQDCALADTIWLALDQLHGRPQEALVVIGTGRDTSRTHTLEEITRRLATDGVRPIVISVADRATAALRLLADTSGGRVFELHQREARVALHERFRPFRGDSSFFYDLRITGAPDAAAQLSVTVGSENAASDTARL